MFPKLPDDVLTMEGDPGNGVPDSPRLLFCNRGQHWKPGTREHFYVNRALKRGFTADCKDCTREARGQTKKARKEVRPGFYHCPECKRDLPKTSFYYRNRETGTRNTYCRTCDTAKKSKSRWNKIINGTLDPATIKRDARKAKALGRRRTRERQEYRAMLHARARFLIDALRNHGVSYAAMSRECKVRDDTLTRWVREPNRLPDRPPLERAIRALEAMVKTYTTPDTFFDTEDYSNPLWADLKKIGTEDA